LVLHHSNGSAENRCCCRMCAKTFPYRPGGVTLRECILALRALVQRRAVRIPQERPDWCHDRPHHDASGSAHLESRPGLPGDHGARPGRLHPDLRVHSELRGAPPSGIRSPRFHGGGAGGPPGRHARLLRTRSVAGRGTHRDHDGRAAGVPAGHRVPGAPVGVRARSAAARRHLGVRVPQGRPAALPAQHRAGARRHRRRTVGDGGARGGGGGRGARPPPPPPGRGGPWWSPRACSPAPWPAR
jgi:hypothetical protein